MVTRISVQGVPKQTEDLYERSVPNTKERCPIPCGRGPSRVRGASWHTTVTFVVKSRQSRQLCGNIYLVEEERQVEQVEEKTAEKVD